MKHKIDLFIFDLDGTLINSEADIAASTNATRIFMGLEPLPSHEIASYVGRGVHTLLSKALGTEDEQVIQKSADFFLEHYLQHCVDQTKLYPGVQEVLQSFQDRHLAIVTNKPNIFTKKILNKLEIIHYFSIVLSGDSFGKHKPDPAPLLHAMTQVNAQPECSVMVGDSRVDVEAGKRAGTLTCAVTYGFGDPAELVNEFEPHYLVNSFFDLNRHFG